MPDGTEVAWDYDTVRELGQDADRRQERQGRDPGRLRSREDHPVGLRAPARRPARAGRLFGAGSWSATDGKTVQIPDAWAAGWKYFYDGDLDRPHRMTDRPSRARTSNPDGYPFFTGNVAHERELPVVDLRPRAAGDDWDMAAIPSYNGSQTAAFNADTFRILKDTKHPDEAFEVLTYLLGEALQRPAPMYGGMPARDRRPAGVLRRRSRPRRSRSAAVDWQVAMDGVAVRRHPELRVVMPAYNESLDLARPVPDPWTTTPGLDMDTEIDALSELRSAGDLGQASLTRRASCDLAAATTTGQPSDRLTRDRASRPGDARLTPLARREARWGYLFISPWIIGFLLFTLVPMVATLRLHVHQPQPRPGRSRCVRRARQLPGRCSRDRQAWDSLASRSGSRCCGCRSRSSCRSWWRCCSTAGTLRGARRLPDPVLPALRRAVRGGRAHLAGHARARDGLGQRRAALRRHRRTRPTGCTTRRWVYPGLVFIGIWGIGAGDHLNLAGLRASPPSCTTRRASMAPAAGRRCAT